MIVVLSKFLYSLECVKYMNYKSVVAKQLDDSAVQYCNLNSKHYKKYIIIQKKVI